MKRARLSLVVVILFFSLTFAQPTYYGTRGLMRTISADNQGKSFLTLTFHGNYYQEAVSQSLENPQAYTLRNAHGYLSGAFALMDYIELSGGIGSALASDKTVYAQEKSPTKFGFGDTYMGVKLSFAPVWWLKFGGYGFYTLPTGSSVLKDKGYTSRKETFGGIACITFDFLSEKATIPIPLRFHLNGGYLIDKNDSLFESINQNKNINDLLLLRGGIEIPAGAFDLFADFSTEQAINNKDLRFRDNPMRITPGVRFYSPGSVLDLGVEIGLGKVGVEAIPNKTDRMSWRVLFGVSFIGRIVQPKIYSIVSGTVTDADTKAPIKAIVKSVGDTTIQPTMSDENGHYKLRLPAGPHSLTFSAEGYKEMTKSIEVKDSLGIALDIALEPIVSYGIITGKVFNSATGEPLSGKITFPQTSLPPVEVDPATGVYSAKLPVGNYTMELEIPGYYKQTEAVVVSKNQTTQKDLALKPVEKDEGVLTGKVSDQATGQALGGVIRFPGRTDIKPIQVDPQTGTYKATLPSGSYTIEIESPGYNKRTEVVVINKGQTTKVDLPIKPIEKLVGGKIKGTVKDKNTGAPLEAQITVVEGGAGPVKSSPETGDYLLDLPSGTYTIKVERQGYLPTTQTVVVREKETTIQEFVLRPIPMGTLTGKVVNTKDKLPLRANISFPGTDFAAVTADENGIFQTTLPPGTYTVKAEYPEFVTQAFPVVIEDGKTTVQNFELIRMGEKITLRGIYFDFNKATIKPESYPTLNEAVKILKDNPRLRVRIEGHTDSVGSDEYNLKLSQARADAVKNYLVKQGGIDPGRIESLGKGEKEPIASNDTEDGRALNRRIEFIVIGEQ